MKQCRSIFCWLAMALLFWGASASAMFVSVEIAWGYDEGITQDQLTANHLTAGSSIQAGSIIQVVAYNSGSASAPNPNGPVGNFTPYGGSFLPDTTPEGHRIVGTGNVGILDTVDSTHNVYGTTIWVDLDAPGGPYDTLYVRVFQATDFQYGDATDSWWGISDTHYIEYNPLQTALTFFDDTPLTQSNAFELIPEPSSLSFLLSGGCGMGVFALFRRRRPLRPSEE